MAGQNKPRQGQTSGIRRVISDYGLPIAGAALGASVAYHFMPHNQSPLPTLCLAGMSAKLGFTAGGLIKRFYRNLRGNR